MTEGAFNLIAGVLAQLLRLFNSWYIPGTHMTPLSFMFLLSFVSLFVAFVRKLSNQDSNIKGVIKNITKRSGE